MHYGGGIGLLHLLQLSYEAEGGGDGSFVVAESILQHGEVHPAIDVKPEVFCRGIAVSGGAA